MADKTKPDDQQGLLFPVQESLSVAGFNLRTARNRAEGVALAMPEPNQELTDEVNALGAVIKRVDAISSHLRKIGEAK